MKLLGSVSLWNSNPCRIWLLLLTNVIGNTSWRLTRIRKLPLPIPATNHLPTIVLAVNSLAAPKRTTDSCKRTKIRRSQLHLPLPHPCFLKTNPIPSPTYLVLTASSLPKSGSTVWTTSFVCVAVSQVTWFQNVLRLQNQRLRPAPLLLLPLPLPFPLPL